MNTRSHEFPDNRSQSVENENDEPQAIQRVPRSSLIGNGRVRELSRRRPLALVLCLGLDYAIILGAVVASEFFWHPGLYVLAVMIIGARLTGIGAVALHDGAHRMLSRCPRRNDRIAGLLGLSAGVPIVEDFHGYRKRHFAHHRCTNTDDDPDVWIPEKFYEIPRWKGALFFLQAISGVIFIQVLIGFFIRQWKKSRGGFVIALGVTVAIAAGIVTGFRPAVLFGLYWVVPLATWGLFVNLLRALAEHYPETQFQRSGEIPEIFRTRDVLNNWFDQVFVATRGVNFHLSHHLVPSVPFYALPELQHELALSEPYRNYAHVTRGYYRFFVEFFFQRSAPAGQAG